MTGRRRRRSNGVLSCWLIIHMSYLSNAFIPQYLSPRVMPFWTRSNVIASMPRDSPIPVMPSQIFQSLALSQLELLANSLSVDGIRTIRSLALYLPQENSLTGQLEFLPAVLYPNPRPRVFIASQADSGVAPTLPRTLTTLPGFAHATSLLPDYPMVSSSQDEPSVGVVEEVLCDLGSKGTALSVPLFAGSRTVGVLLVSEPSRTWTAGDRAQVARAAKTLSLALAMDADRQFMALKQQSTTQALSDSLHQLKNPLQALRTYGKLLQRSIAKDDDERVKLAEHLMVQTDRLVDRLKPVDEIIDRMPALRPAPDRTTTALIPWSTPEPHYQHRTVINATDSIQSSTVIPDTEMEIAFVDEVLEPILSAFQAIADDREIGFAVEQSDELPGVLIRPGSLQEAVSNVVDNAFKYCHLSEREPGVRVTIEPNDHALSAGVTIRVEDSGPGIGPEDIGRIFSRGYRSPTTRFVNGSGIGLDIARTLIEDIGGEIDVSANPSSLGGATFTIVLYRKPQNT